MRSAQDLILTSKGSLSEPEDSMSSGIESFDEDDMYPVDYDDEAVSDEAVSDSSDADGELQFPTKAMVRT